MCEMSPPIVFSSLGLVLKLSTAWFLWQTGVATGIKGVCHHYLVCKADPVGLFYFLIFRQALFIKIQMKYYYIVAWTRLDRWPVSPRDSLVSAGIVNVWHYL